MRRCCLIAFLLLLAAPSQAELSRLLDFQQLGDSGAYISSGFHDWRTVSKYRRHAGLHYGYDIAMLAGSPVRAAWPGTVVAITPWYGAEYGVTVRDDKGYEATYGHISPWVKVGTRVSSGTLLGSVVVDHVDVKMRNSRGQFVDFAALVWEEPSTERVSPPAEQVLELENLERRREELAKELAQKRFEYEAGLASLAQVTELEREWRELSPKAKETSDARSWRPDLQETPSRSTTDSLILGTNPRP